MSSWYWKCMQQAAQDVLDSAADDAKLYDLAWQYYGKFTSYELYLESEEWRQKSRDAIGYAEYRCQLCNRKDTPLNTHHRTYERLGRERPEDLIVLCQNCHEHHHRRVLVYAPAGAVTSTIR